MSNLNNIPENNEEPIDMSKVSPAFREYIRVRDEFLAKYGKVLPDFKKAA